MKNKKVICRIICILLCAVFMTGCGRSLVLNTGFRRGEVFRVGKARGKIKELRVYMLDLQKQSEALYGEAIWESADSDKIQQAVKDQALSQLTRVKALGQIAISRNVMLTNDEEDRARKAEQAYFAGLSEEEKKYIGLDEEALLGMMREYAIAARMWWSLGESALETYEEYYAGAQCDLNVKYWQSIELKRVEGDPSVPGFAKSYEDAFAGVTYPGNEAADAEAVEAAGEDKDDEAGGAENGTPDGSEAAEAAGEDKKDEEGAAEKGAAGDGEAVEAAAEDKKDGAGAAEKGAAGSGEADKAAGEDKKDEAGAAEKGAAGGSEAEKAAGEEGGADKQPDKNGKTDNAAGTDGAGQ